jgi:sugar phosphate isomerase/epimerase
MPGDGIIDIPRIRAAVEGQGFGGFVEVEIFSNRWWSAPMDEVITTCIARMKTAV